jgi:hypothetical protein
VHDFAAGSRHALDFLRIQGFFVPFDAFGAIFQRQVNVEAMTMIWNVFDGHMFISSGTNYSVGQIEARKCLLEIALFSGLMCMAHCHQK